MNSKQYTAALLFFMDNAGYAREPGEPIEEAKAKCARRLIEAEEWARDQGYRFDWEVDEWKFADSPAHDVWQCSMHPGPDSQCVQSLSGIDFGAGVSPYGEPYMRVVEAELAYQEMQQCK